MVETCSGKHISSLQKHGNNCKGKGKNVGWGVFLLSELPFSKMRSNTKGQSFYRRPGAWTPGLRLFNLLGRIRSGWVEANVFCLIWQWYTLKFLCPWEKMSLNIISRTKLIFRRKRNFSWPSWASAGAVSATVMFRIVDLQKFQMATTDSSIRSAVNGVVSETGFTISM